MRSKIFAGAVGLAMGGAMLTAPAQAVELPHSAQASSVALPGTAISYHDNDYWKHRRKAEKRYYKQQRRYARERQYYDEPVYRDTRVWRGNDGRVYCRKRDGTTGLIIGGALGALLGREIDGRGDRALGTILGAAGGAILGREVERGRCR